jgi:hypothetical protein
LQIAVVDVRVITGEVEGRHRSRAGIVEFRFLEADYVGVRPFDIRLQPLSQAFRNEAMFTETILSESAAGVVFEAVSDMTINDRSLNDLTDHPRRVRITSEWRLEAVYMGARLFNLA